MKITERLNAAYSALTTSSSTALVLHKQAPPLELKHSEARRVAMMHRVGVEQWAPTEYRNLVRVVRTNPIVRRAVQLISDAVASIEPVIRRGERSEGGDIDAIAKQFSKPNPVQDRASFAKETAGYLALSGNTFIEHAAGMAGYHEFYALRPELMTITPGEDGWTQRYSYRPASGRRKDWNVNIARGKSDILHLKDFSPDDDLWGHGALEAVQLPLAIYDNAQMLSLSMFKNGAMPSGAMVYNPSVASGQPQPTLTDKQYEDLKKAIDERFSGPKNAGRPMLLDGGLEWQQFSMSFVDMQADLIRNAAARDIALGFGIPPMLLGIPGDNTYSNYQEANRAFYRQTVLSLAQTIYGGIGRWWAVMLSMPDLEFHVDPDQLWALAEEVAIREQRIEGSLMRTPNEKRKLLKLTALPPEEGDVMLVSGGLVPLSQVTAPPALDPTGDYGAPPPGPGARKVDKSADGDKDGRLNEGDNPAAA